MNTGCSSTSSTVKIRSTNVQNIYHEVSLWRALWISINILVCNEQMQGAPGPLLSLVLLLYSRSFIGRESDADKCIRQSICCRIWLEQRSQEPFSNAHWVLFSMLLYCSRASFFRLSPVSGIVESTHWHSRSILAPSRNTDVQSVSYFLGPCGLPYPRRTLCHCLKWYCVSSQWTVKALRSLWPTPHH